MRALTIHQPWATLLALGEKDVENRSWGPPRTLLPDDGDAPFFALHAGVRLDLRAWDATRYVLRAWGYEDPESLPLGCVVGVARVYGLVEPGSALLCPSTGRRRFCDSQWFDGKRAWAIVDAVHFEHVMARDEAGPLRCRGAQGVWTLPGLVAGAVYAEMARLGRKA